uniref:Death domain containing 1 n=1 Tax=Seriola dumerili TaxID=41447 RepID=A0A3B4VGA0_SERDU
MDDDLLANKQTDEAESLHGRREEDSLLNMLTETIQGVEADRRSTDHYKQTVGGRRCTGEEPGRGEEIQRGSEERMLSPAEDEEEDEEEGEGRGRNTNEEQLEKECKQKVLRVLKELSVFHSERVAAWKEALRECASMLNKCPPGGGDQQLTGKMEDSQSNTPDACFIRAPMGVAEVLRCEVADAFSCLMVTGSEELVSRVIRVKVQDRANFHFPVTVVMPFCARYRGSYRDVTVKIMDGERRVSYVTPVTTEGTYGGQRGSFAEVKVYSLGFFAVVSCLKRENYTVPSRGLSLKLPMDQRICLNYLPGAFTAPVMAQIMIQPLDAVLLAAVKSRSDVYYSVVSTSPLLYLTHPTSQPLRRPLTVTLPCPPNPERKRKIRGQGEETKILGALKSSKETSNEQLIVLGSKDKQWSVLEKVTVRNQQDGLASFELTENFDRFVTSGFLLLKKSLLEESVGCHAVTVVLQHRQDKPHTVLLAALPSRDLSWELNKLRAQGYSGLLETSSDISMCEGDQLLLRFSGNITSTGGDGIAFHSQRINHLLVRLTEVDPFGNHSSPHYKGAAVFYKVTRGELEWRGDKAAPKDGKLLGDPVYSLPDSLLLWLAGELSEEEIALLALSLRLRRSAAQLVKLRAGDSLSTQAFHVLAMWRRALPAAPHQPKASQLAHCLAKSGRPDLARELLLRQAAATRQGSLK